MRFTSRADMKRGRDCSERQGERQEQRRGDEADQSETADRAEARGRPFHQNAVERPGEARGEGDGKSGKGDRAAFSARLKPKDADRADQAEKGADLKLPLANDPALFREKDQREERGDDDGGADEDRENARAHVKEGDGLRDLMDDVWERRDEAGEQNGAIKPRSAAPEAIKHERQDGEAGDGIAVKILRPGIVEAVEIELKEGRRRPDEHGREDGGVTLGECSLFRHFFQPLANVVSIRKKAALACNRFTSPSSRRTNMNNYKIGTVISLAIAFVACPTDLFCQKKRPRSAPQSAATNPQDPGGHSAPGVEAAKNRDYETAIAEFTKAIEAEPEDAKNYFNRGDGLSRGQQTGRSVGGFHQGDRARSDRMREAYIGRGEVLLPQKQLDQALADFDKALEIAPNDAYARRFRGFVFVSKSEWQKAIDDYTIVIQKVPDDGGAYERRAFAYRNLKKYKEAIADYTKAIAIDPKDPDGYRRRALDPHAGWRQQERRGGFPRFPQDQAG